MICKSCGTEYKGEFCPHCGEKLTPRGAPSSSHTVAVPVESIKKVYRPALSLKMVLWQGIALLLPLAYLFFDVFVQKTRPFKASKEIIQKSAKYCYDCKIKSQKTGGENTTANAPFLLFLSLFPKQKHLYKKCNKTFHFGYNVIFFYLGENI